MMKEFILKINLYKFFDSFTIIFSIFTLLFQKAGLNTLQISLLIGIWYFVQVLFEIPTGVLADRFSRRNLLSMASLFQAIGFCFWFGGNFWLFVIGFVFWGIKTALIGGTFQALAYDELKHIGQEKTYKKVIGQTEGWKFLGVSFSAFFAGFIAHYSFSLALLISVCTSLLAGIVMMSIKEVKKVKELEQQNYLSTIQKALIAIKKNRILFFLILLLTIIFSAYGSEDEFWALIYQHMGIPLSSIGMTIAVGYAVFALAGYTVHLYKNLRGNYLSYGFIFTSSFFFLIAGLFNRVFFIPLIFISIYLYQVSNITLEALLQHTMPSDLRATIFSIKSFLFEILGILFLFIFGLCANVFGVQSVLTISGILIAVVIVAFFIAQISLHLRLDNLHSD